MDTSTQRSPAASTRLPAKINGNRARSLSGTRASCSKFLSARVGPALLGFNRSPPTRVRTLTHGGRASRSMGPRGSLLSSSRPPPFGNSHVLTSLRCHARSAPRPAEGRPAGPIDTRPLSRRNTASPHATWGFASGRASSSGPQISSNRRVSGRRKPDRAIQNRSALRLRSTGSVRRALAARESPSEARSISRRATASRSRCPSAACRALRATDPATLGHRVRMSGSTRLRK